MNKPILDKSISINDFKDFYWLKEELVDFCRNTGISSAGGKIDISNRIIHFLEKGEMPVKSPLKKCHSTSTFDWNKETLSLDTRITDNYKNTKNVRAFFLDKIDTHFRFNVELMNWMKANQGKTLGDAIEKWKEITQLKKDKNYNPVIAPQFEYNAYIRDFLTDNPELKLKDAINCWKIKRNKPGGKKYTKADLLFIVSCDASGKTSIESIRQ